MANKILYFTLCLLKIIDPNQELDQVEDFQDIRTIMVARRTSEKIEYDIIQYTRKWARPTKCKDIFNNLESNQTNNKILQLISEVFLLFAGFTLKISIRKQAGLKV